MRILHTSCIQGIIGELRHELEVEVGIQRVQNHDVFKVGNILGMMDKIGTREWSDCLQKMLLMFLK